MDFAKLGFAAQPSQQPETPKPLQSKVKVQDPTAYSDHMQTRKQTKTHSFESSNCSALGKFAVYKIEDRPFHPRKSRKRLVHFPPAPLAFLQPAQPLLLLQRPRISPRLKKTFPPICKRCCHPRARSNRWNSATQQIHPTAPLTMTPR